MAETPSLATGNEITHIIGPQVEHWLLVLLGKVLPSVLLLMEAMLLIVDACQKSCLR